MFGGDDEIETVPNINEHMYLEVKLFHITIRPYLNSILHSNFSIPGGCTWYAVCTLLELSMWNRVCLAVLLWITSLRPSGALSLASSVRWTNTARQGSASAATLDSVRASSMSLGKQVHFRAVSLADSKLGHLYYNSYSQWSLPSTYMYVNWISSLWLQSRPASLQVE